MSPHAKHPWPLVRLGAVLAPVERAEKVNPTASYRLLGVRLDGNGAFLRETVTGTQTSAPTLYRVEPDDFIFSRLFACRGAFAVIGPELAECHVSGEFPTFRPKLNAKGQPGIDVRYLRYWFTLPVIVATVNEQCTGSTPLTRNRFKEDKFLALEIPLPPLAEQRRLVARLDDLAERIAHARKLRDEAEEEAATLYGKSLATFFNDTTGNWIHETVQDVMVTMDAGWSPQCSDGPAGNGAWGVLKTTAVQWNEFRPNENKALPPSLAPNPNLGVVAGDVLVTRAGPRSRVGVVACVRNDSPRLMISDKIIRIRPDTSKIDARFLELTLSAPNSQEYLVQRKTGLADAQVNISQSILRAMPLSYPGSLAEQRRIVAELDALQAKVDALKQLQAGSAASLDALMPALLDRAFKGEL